MFLLQIYLDNGGAAIAADDDDDDDSSGVAWGLGATLTLLVAGGGLYLLRFDYVDLTSPVQLFMIAFSLRLESIASPGPSRGNVNNELLVERHNSRACLYVSDSRRLKTISRGP